VTDLMHDDRAGTTAPEAHRADPPSRRRGQVLLAAVAAFIVLFVLLDSTAGLHASACGACHTDYVEGSRQASHAGVHCLSCHLESGAWSVPGFKVQQWFVMYPAQIAGTPPPPAREVSRSACLSCHEDQVAPGIVERGGLRIAHATCAPTPEKCVGCHGGVSHGTVVRWSGQPEMDACVACHRSRSAPAQCDTCHEGRLEVERLRRGPWRVTHGPEWSSTHAMGSYKTCATCHTTDFCVKCHQVPVPHPKAFGSTHGSFAKAPDASCESCHTTQSFCEECHGIDMPHPDGFLAGHKDQTSGLEDPVCYPCHETKGCTICHARHDAHPRGADMLRWRTGS
jgi:hypothetical protein